MFQEYISADLEKTLVEGAIWAGIGTIIGLALGLARGRSFINRHNI
jgi:hypothetical protein